MKSPVMTATAGNATQSAHSTHASPATTTSLSDISAPSSRCWCWRIIRCWPITRMRRRATTLVAQPRWWQAFPVVDPQKWTGFSFFVGFNDIFFMSLMFFLSGLFVSRSLERKGVSTFLRDRLLAAGPALRRRRR